MAERSATWNETPDEADLPSDPVIEEYKKHVDVTLLRENLRRSPEARVLAMMDMQRLVEEMRNGLRRPGHD